MGEEILRVSIADEKIPSFCDVILVQKLGKSHCSLTEMETWGPPWLLKGGGALLHCQFGCSGVVLSG